MKQKKPKSTLGKTLEVHKGFKQRPVQSLLHHIPSLKNKQDLGNIKTTCRMILFQSFIEIC